MQKPDAAERVRARIQEWLDREGRGSKKRLASEVQAKYGKPHGQQWVSGLISERPKGRQDLRLRDLDTVADLMGIPPGELVRKNDRNYLELTMSESRLIGYYRKLPDQIRQHWMAWLDHLFRFQESLLDQGLKIRDDMTGRMRQFEAHDARLKKRSP